MNEKQQQEWLKSLKIGDSICYLYTDRRSRKSRYIEVKVKNITKSGNIRLEDGNLIKLGEPIAYKPFTQEVILFNENEKLKIKLEDTIRTLKVNNLDIEKVKQILEILGDE